MKKAKMARPTPAQIFAMLDSDKDGQVLRDEVPKQLQPVFDRLDSNADGILEKSELPK